MSQHPLPQSSSRHGRRSFAILCTFAAGVALVGWLAAHGTHAAAAPNPDAPATAAPGLSDVMLARSVLTALDADAELKGVNLVVSVVDRVAVIGGPVATTRQARRAEELVRAVPGIERVKNTCFVTQVPDPLLKAVADRLGSTLPERPTMPDLPGVLTGTMPTSPFPPGGAEANRVAAKPGTVTALKPPLPAGTAIGFLGAPVGASGKTNTAAATPPPPPATAPGVLTGTTPPAPVRLADVLAAAGEARKAEARFARLTVEMRDGVLVIGGSAPQPSDAWDFAAKLRTIPGVTRVAVGNVNGK
jgi:hypothetical protein